MSKTTPKMHKNHYHITIIYLHRSIHKTSDCKWLCTRQIIYGRYSDSYSYSHGMLFYKHLLIVYFFSIFYSLLCFASQLTTSHFYPYHFGLSVYFFWFAVHSVRSFYRLFLTPCFLQSRILNWFLYLQNPQEYN